MIQGQRKEACPRTRCEEHRWLWTADLRPPQCDLLSWGSQVYAKKVAPLAVNKTSFAVRKSNALPFLASGELGKVPFFN